MLPLREAILLTRNENLTNDHGVIGPGEETQDYLFVMTPEEMERYLAPVAEHFAGVYYWTRTPVEGTVDDGCTAALLPDEHGGISVSLSTHPLILSQPVLAAMWVDTDLLLQGWSQFGK